MMMQALRAGGLPVLTDDRRVADEDNPRGYVEFEPVTHIARARGWVPQAQGRAVKVVSPLLRHLPPEYRYQVIFMRRNLAEILASQQQMLRRRKPAADGDDASLARAFERHLSEIAAWLGTQANVTVIYVDYHHVLSDPATQLQRLCAFLRRDLAVDAMVAVVDRQLHRQRA